MSVKRRLFNWSRNQFAFVAVVSIFGVHGLPANLSAGTTIGSLVCLPTTLESPRYEDVVLAQKFLEDAGSTPCLQSREFPGGCSILSNCSNAYVVVCGAMNSGTTCGKAAVAVKEIANTCKNGSFTKGSLSDAVSGW